MYKAIKSHVSDYNNFYDNLFGTITVYENTNAVDTGLVNQEGITIYNLPDKIKLGFDLNTNAKKQR